MGLTLTRIKGAAIGNLKLRIVDATYDASYAAGGESLTADDLGCDPVFVLAEPTDGYVFEYDKGASKLMAFFSDNNAVADGVLIEASGDLSSVVVRLMAIGV